MNFRRPVRFYKDRVPHERGRPTCFGPPGSVDNEDQRWDVPPSPWEFIPVYSNLPNFKGEIGLVFNIHWMKSRGWINVVEAEADEEKKEEEEQKTLEPDEESVQEEKENPEKKAEEPLENEDKEPKISFDRGVGCSISAR